MVETQHADATDPTMSRPRGPHHPAHRTPVPSTAFLQLRPRMLRRSRPVVFGHGHVHPPPVDGRVSVRQRAVIRHPAVDGLLVRSHNAEFPLGVDEGGQGEYDPDGHHGQLDQTNIPIGKHLSDEQVVHVCQGEEGQAEEEEGPSFLAVGEVVVPQHQAGQSCQDHHADQEVESSDVQKDRQENKRRDDGQIHFSGSTP